MSAPSLRFDGCRRTLPLTMIRWVCRILLTSAVFVGIAHTLGIPLFLLMPSGYLLPPYSGRYAVLGLVVSSLVAGAGPLLLGSVAGRLIAKSRDRTGRNRKDPQVVAVAVALIVGYVRGTEMFGVGEGRTMFSLVGVVCGFLAGVAMWGFWEASRYIWRTRPSADLSPPSPSSGNT